MNPLTGEKAPSTEAKESALKSFVAKLRKRHILETFAGFIAGGWLILEFVDRILVAHYHINEKWLDVAFFTLLGALICVILWRWFRGTEKRPGNVKVEVLIVPLIILIALTIDLILVFQIAGLPPRKLLISFITFLLGIAWIVFKSLQWAAIPPAFSPGLGKKEVELSSTAEVKTERSIVVLPFKNISSEEGQDYFSDGMTEELITKLAMVRELCVISRTSAFMFKNAQKTAKEIAGQLDVSYVLEGSVRKAGHKLRITAQLIDAIKDTHLWSDTYDGVLEDVFDIQEKVSQAIVDGLKLQLTPEETRRMAERPVTDLKAYECYLRATSAIDRATEDSINEAIRNLELALKIVGENVILYYGMGYAYWWLSNIGISIKENLSKCKEYAKKAISIDPLSTKSHALYWFAGINYQNNQQLHETHIHLKEVLKQDPNDSLALLGLIFISGWAGQFPSAMLLFTRYAEREPFSFWTFVLPFFLNMEVGQYQLAFEMHKKALEALSYPISLVPLSAWALAWIGRTDEAIAKVDQLARDMPNHFQTKLALMLKHGLKRDILAAHNELGKDFYEWCYGECTWSYFVAATFALANSKEDALNWLEHAVDLGWTNYPNMANQDPFLSNIRGEERFQKLMERVKYEWEHFEV